MTEKTLKGRQNDGEEPQINPSIDAHKTMGSVIEAEPFARMGLRYFHHAFPSKTESLDEDSGDDIVVCGIDVHKQKFNLHILDASENFRKPRSYARTFQRQRHFIDTAVRVCQDRHVRVVILESTSIYHKVIEKAFRDAGIRAIVVNAGLIAPKSRFQNKNDKLDAKKLAWLYHRGEIGDHEGASFKPSYTSECETEEKLRKLLRLREQTLKASTQKKNRIHKICDLYALDLRTYLGPLSFSKRWYFALNAVAQGISYEKAFAQLENSRIRRSVSAQKKNVRSFITYASNDFDTTDIMMLRRLLAGLVSDQETVAQLESEIDNIIAQAPESFLRRLEIANSIPGMNGYIAIGVVAEYGDLHRLSNRRKAARYTGLDVTIRSSGGKTVMCGISKAGNKKLRRHLFLAARVAMAKDRKFRSYYKRLRERKNGLKHTQALCALGRKLGVLYYSLVLHDELYSTRKNRMKHPHKTEGQ